MRVVIISESPALPTGFARTTRLFAEKLTDMGHEIICYGIGSWGETFDRSLYPYRIWPAGDFTDNYQTNVLKFHAFIKPDLLILNYDLITTLIWIEFLKQTGIKTRLISHLVVDGLPVYPVMVEPLAYCAAIIVPTVCVANFLSNYLLCEVLHFPHLVNCDEFLPVASIRTLKAKRFAGKVVIGIIAQNRARKQIVQVIHAVSLLKHASLNPFLLIHTDRENATRLGGNNLKQVVSAFALDDSVNITTSNRCYDALAERSAMPISANICDTQQWVKSLTIAERINCCDVITVPSAYGGFEYSILESQACKIPVCSTEDEGAMSEVAGDATEKLSPSLYEFTDYGAKMHKIAPTTIADAIIRIVTIPSRKQRIIDAGLINAEKYSFTANQKRLDSLMEKIIAKAKSLSA